MTKINFNIKRLEEKLFKLHFVIGYKLGELCQAQLTEEKRDYPRTTVRKEGKGKTGKIATSPRDVVDTGELVNSFVFTHKKKVNKLFWTAPHAVYIYTGWTSSTGTRVPSYPWIENALKEIDWKSFIKECWSIANGM